MAGVFLLILASLGVQEMARVTGDVRLHGVYDLFHLNGELNIPTFYSALLLLFAALILAVIAVQKAKDKEPFVPHWAFLSFGFLCMAADEVMSFHERLVIPVQQCFGHRALGCFERAWVIPAIPFVLILGLYYLPFLLHLPGKTRLRFVAAASIYLGGAIGFEMLSGCLRIPYCNTMEESLEMAGSVCFIWASLKYMAGTCDEVRFQMNDIPRKHTLRPTFTVAAGGGLIALILLGSVFLLPSAPVKWFYPARSLPSQTGEIDGKKRVAVSGRDAPGFLSYGPYICLPAGRYVAEVRYSSRAESTQSVGWVDVCGFDGTRVFARTDLQGTSGRDHVLRSDFKLVSRGCGIEARVWFDALEPVVLTSVEIRAIKADVPTHR